MKKRSLFEWALIMNPWIATAFIAVCCIIGSFFIGERLSLAFLVSGITGIACTFVGVMSELKTLYEKDKQE